MPSTNPRIAFGAGEAHTRAEMYLSTLLYKKIPKPEKGIGKKLPEGIGGVEYQKQMPQGKYQSCCDQ